MGIYIIYIAILYWLFPIGYSLLPIAYCLLCICLFVSNVQLSDAKEGGKRATWATGDAC